MKTPWYILDTECASLQGGVCELAYLKVDHDLNIEDEVCIRLNPERPIEPGAFAVHGISDEAVADCPTLADAAKVFEGRPITMLAHNANFDRRMIKGQIEVDVEVCTLHLARKYVKDVSNYKLETLQKELGLSEQKSHSALGDVQSVRDLLLFMIENCGLDLKTTVERAHIPALVHTMPFGKHAGRPLTAVPASYRTWLLSTDIDENLRYSLKRLQGV
jgi:exodeoxyribonuclease X